MIIVEMWYAIKHSFQKNKDICPKCGKTAFSHGFEPYEEYYCTKCNLWKPNWIKELKNDNK